MSWVDYESLSERAALLKTARQLGVDDTDSLRAAYRLLIETQRHRAAIDYTIGQVLGKERFENLRLGVKNAMRIIAYSKHWERSSDQHVARILAAIRKAIGWREIAPFEYEIARLTAVERFESLSQLPESDRISILYSHPKWFVEKCVAVFGRHFALAMLRRNQKPAPNYIVINPIKAASPSRIKTTLGKLGVELEELNNWLFRVGHSGKPIPVTKPYRTGAILPLDKSSFYAALVLAPRSRDRVLDACAAPGTKTAVISMQMKNRGTIVATDLSAKRMRTAATSLTRLGISNVHLLVVDARNHMPIGAEFDFNRVLVDAPCSNSGVFMRTPSARWHANPARIEALRGIQEEILAAASAKVTAGGVLVYSTCSVLPEENEMVIERFLVSNPDFRLVDAELPEGSPGLRGMTAARRLYPHIHECNGFFIAKLERS